MGNDYIWRSLLMGFTIFSIWASVWSVCEMVVDIHGKKVKWYRWLRFFGTILFLALWNYSLLSILSPTF